MALDPARWPARWQGMVLAIVVASYFLAAVLGSAWIVAALPLFGVLVWRYQSMPWREIATWTIPLFLWMAGLVLIRPAPLAGLVGLGVAGGWLALFTCRTPLVRWWYRFVLRTAYRQPTGLTD